MKAFKFRLETLLSLRELVKDRAVRNYAKAIANRVKFEKDLETAVSALTKLNSEITLKRNVGFSGFEQKNFNQLILQAKELIIDQNAKLAESKSIEEGKRKLFLAADSNCKSLIKLKEKNKIEHLKREEKREESELEDIIGARFVFNQAPY